MAIIATAIAAITSIALSIGLTKAADALNERFKNKEDVTPSDIQNAVAVVANEARSKGQSTINELQNQLMSISSNIPGSSVVKKAIISYKKDLRDKISTAERLMAEGDSASTKAQNAAASYNSLGTLSRRGFVGKIYKDQVETANAIASDKYGQVEKLINN